MNDSRIQAAAQWRMDQYQARRPYDHLSAELEPANYDEAYAMQRALMVLRGKPIVGYKVSSTSEAARKHSEMAAGPHAGCLLEGVVMQSPARISVSQVQTPGLEAEVAFRLASDLSPANRPYTAESLVKYVDCAFPAVEVVDDRHAHDQYMKRYPLRSLDIVADNNWNAGLVLGEPVRNWQTFDLAALQARMHVNGKLGGEGYGSDVLGHPLNSLAWLVNKVTGDGDTVRAGMVVTTGTMIVVQWVKAGDQAVMDMGAFGRVLIEVAA